MALCALITLPLMSLLVLMLWQTPYGISETVALLADIQDRHPREFFALHNPYVRPLFYSALWLVWHGASSVAEALAVFKALHVATVVALIVLFVSQVRPRSATDFAAALFGIAVLVGMPAFRGNLENLPWNQTLVIMVLSLCAWAVLERPHRWWHDPLLVAISIVAVGFKEQGLVIPVLIVSARLLRAPGVRASAAIVAVVFTGVYLAVRFLNMPGLPGFEQSVGLGFQELSTRAVNERYGASPLPIYLYNAVSTALNVLFSEPTRGVFQATHAIWRGAAAPWVINHVASSTVLTIVLVCWGASALRARRDADRQADVRLLCGTVVVLMASSALGFNYTRDRMGGVAAVFYALAAGAAMKWLLTRAPHRPAVPRVALIAVMVALALAWQVRAIGTVQYVRDTATKNRREWLVDLGEGRRDKVDRRSYVEILDAMVEQGADPTTPNVRRDPRWFAQVLGER